MSEFDRPLAGFRLVDVLHGDTLQEIAARELGDASMWVDIANINNLIPPYITDNPDEASDRVLLSGGVLLVPARTPIAGQGGTTEADIYGTDLLLRDGDLVAENGSLVVVSGRENLKQALINRNKTERGEMLWNPTYGSMVRSLLGAVSGPSSALLAAQYVAATFRADYRVKDVASSRATVAGDVVRVVCEVVPVSGQSQKIEVVI